MSQPTEYLYLTEGTLPRLLWRVVTRGPTCIIGIFSFASGGEGGLLRRLADRMRAAGRVTDFTKDCADWMTYADDIALIVGEDVFIKNEPAIEQIFDFPGSDSRFGRYGRPFRHAVCNQSINRLILIHRIDDICRTTTGAQLSGIDPEVLALYEIRFGAPPRLTVIPGLRLRTLFNLVGALLSTLLGIAWTLTRIRPNPTPAEDVLLGSDFCNDPRDALLWEEVSDDLQSVVAVFRNEHLRKTGLNLIEGRRSCCWTEGVFSPRSGVAAAWELARDSAILLTRGWRLPPDIFRNLIRLPYHRMTFRAVFNRFRFRFFWDRADYNTDHIIRSQELRAIGGKSLGLMHGITSIASCIHQMRHLDYDIYFAMGRRAYDRHYRHTWPKSMTTHFIGCFALARTEFHQLALPPDGQDMAFFIVPAVQGNATLDMAAKVAKTFPDRIIYLNTKEKYLIGGYRDAIDAVVAGNPNVVLHQGRSYDLMFKCRYVVTDGSTLTAEAIQFGLYGFMLDTLGSRWKTNLYRDFPGLVLTGADEFIHKVRAIEAGQWVYPRQACADLIQMSGHTFYDIVREAIGLPAKEGALPHLAFVPGGQA